MSTAQFNQISYGLTQALISEFPEPIISNRNPTVNDKAQLGTLWVNSLANMTFVLTSIVANQANWASSNGTSGITSLTGNAGGMILPLAGNIDILGNAGQLTVSGTPNTLTISLETNIATTYDTDSGDAIPAGNVLNIDGTLHQIMTSGAGSTVSIALTNDVVILGTLVTGDGITVDTGDVDIEAGNLDLPNTTAAFATGTINFGGSPLISNFGTANIFVGYQSGNATLTNTGNSGFGVNSLPVLTTGQGNTALGFNTGTYITTGSDNVMIGENCNGLPLGNLNIGILGLPFETPDGGPPPTDTGTGISNIAIGAGLLFDEPQVRLSLAYLASGSYNIAIGAPAGNQYTDANESSNILIQNTGVTGESNVMRLGTSGSGDGQTNSTYIAGIAGVTVANDAAVLIDTATGQLGTVASSLRYKENVTDLADKSSNVLKLRPVSFNYKNDPKKLSKIGLIAEEVSGQLPDLVVYDSDRLPSTVRYHDLPVLLLNEIKKLVKRIESLESQITILKG